METEEPAWTQKHLQQLLAAMKSSIPEHERSVKYDKTLKTFDWVKVAFEPFSPDECQQKWSEILDKMRKIRSLTELINEAEDVIANPDKNQKIHPERPKRPQTPSCLYFKENYARLREEHPELSSTMLMKSALDKFRTLSDKDKAPYVKKFNLTSDDYAVKMMQFRKDYELKPTQYQREKKKKVSADTTNGEDCDGRANSQPLKPPRNGYNLFCKEQQECRTGAADKSYLRVWAKRWNGLSENEKAKYSESCLKMKQEYKVKLEEYVREFDTKTQQLVLGTHSITKRRKIPCEPKMPSQSGSEAYIQEQMDVLKAKIPNSNKRMLMIKKQWHKLSMAEKTYYKEKVNEDKERYCVRLQRWFKILNSEEQKNYLENNPDKCHYLQTKPTNGSDTEEQSVLIPSDSEDEALEDSSSEEENCYVDLNEDDTEDEEEECYDVTDVY